MADIEMVNAVPGTDTLTREAERMHAYGVPSGRIVNTHFQVKESAPPGMSVTVGDINENVYAIQVGADTYMIREDGQHTLPLDTSSPTLPRIDIVTVEPIDPEVTPGIRAVTSVTTGTPAATPVAPTPTATQTVLAEVLVGAGVTQILDGDITDRRGWAVRPEATSATVYGRYQDGTDIPLSTTPIDIASYTIDIPAYWGDWDLTVWAQISTLLAVTTSPRRVLIEGFIDGTGLSFGFIVEHEAEAGDNEHLYSPVMIPASLMTTTGSHTVRLEASLVSGTSGDVVVRSVVSRAKAFLVF